MTNTFLHIYDFFSKRKGTFFVLLAISFLTIVFFASKITLEEDISKILPNDKTTVQLNRVFSNSKFLDKLVINISLQDSTADENPDTLTQYASDFVTVTTTHLNQYIKALQAKVEDATTLNLVNNIQQNLPLFLEDKDYNTIDSLIKSETIKETLSNDYKTLNSPAGFLMKKLIVNDPIGISTMSLKKLQQLQYDDNFELYDNYVITKNHKNVLLFITPQFPPSNTGKNTLFIKGLDSIIDVELKNKYPNVKASYFGATAVSVGNSQQLRNDTILTQGITLLFIIIFLGIYFRRKSAPILILIPVLFGALFSLSVIYFIKGKISVIALGTGSIVLGIAVNYSLHVFNHYRHTQDIKTLIKDLTLPLTIGSFTTIGGFFCLEFVSSEMLKDLGLFAAFSLIGASLASLIILPHLIRTKHSSTINKIEDLSRLDKIAAYRPEYNKFLIALILIVTVYLGFWSSKVGFQTELSSMNFMSQKLVTAEQELNNINQYSLKSVYLIADGKNLNDVLMNIEKQQNKLDQLKKSGVINKCAGVSSFVLSDSLLHQKLIKWNTYWTKEKKDQLFATLQKEGEALHFNQAFFKNIEELINKDFSKINSSVFDGFKKIFFSDYITENKDLTTVVTLIKVAPEKKQVVYDAFKDEENINVIDKQYLTTKLASIVGDDFNKIAIMTSLLVFFVLFLTYGRIELTLVSFVPMFISWIWILGLMAIFDIQFNIINIIISALIFGLGDDYSLFIMDGLLQEYKTNKKNLSSFKSSIFLSAITTIVGLGVLIFAKHPALKSIAAISIIGILCVVIMSQILIPFFFHILINKRIQHKLSPWTFFSFLKSAFAFSYFICWSIIFSLFAFILSIFKISERTKYIYHYVICKICKSLVYVMFNVKKTILNDAKEDFSKPTIIIANHQSSLDILMLVMLHPKLLMFTNNRIWNSKLFGKVIRTGDYFPAENIESNMELIQQRVNNGYSIIVFPEGTRSSDGVIKRFHKGAFYLAEKLQLDILPVLIHGTNYTLTKNDYLLKNGSITIKILPRIKSSDLSYGSTYQERTKSIAKYFKQEYTVLQNEMEKTRYFREAVQYNYLYKGPAIELNNYLSARFNHDYSLISENTSNESKTLIIGNGFGNLAFYLAAVSSKRIITGIDFNEEKMELANHTLFKSDQLKFECINWETFNFETYDTIIININVLQYSENQQSNLMQKCFSHLNDNGKLLVNNEMQRDQNHFFNSVAKGFSGIFNLKYQSVSKNKTFNVFKQIASNFDAKIELINNQSKSSNSILILRK